MRAAELLHPQRPAAPLREAATLLLLRDTPAGLQVLMTRRSATASFAPGAHVFPGGQVDAEDGQAHHLARRRPGQADAALTHALAAIREAWEELGVLLAYPADGVGDGDLADPALLAGLDRHAPLFAQCLERGLTLAADRVHMVAHWITDRDLARRFDVPFLVARAPEGQVPVADDAEQFAPEWVGMVDALRRHDEGRFAMMFPTRRTLERLARYSSVDELIAACTDVNGGDTALWTSCPRGGIVAGEVRRFMEDDAPFGELALVCPDGQVLHALDWRHDAPVALSRGVARLTAANANHMTGPGTNTYLVGTPATDFAVIDPGPADAQHVARIVAATGGQVRFIVCTHSHSDHSPAAPLLQAACSALGFKAPVLGLPSGPHARPTSFFQPDRMLADCEALELSGGADEYRLRVHHTPGHAANHLCLVLEQDGLLFSGDHILNGNGPVVVPPDGNMGAYLASLDRLEAVCCDGNVEFILPAHGWAMHEPLAVIGRLRRHRQDRQRRVAEAMSAMPEGGLDDWLPLVYPNVPPVLRDMARMSLLAHVESLRA
ncbi:MBL fold metallo-hydrolase [Xylophilus sp. GOD-11R]|uniref:MBL fold metallo-hydrolase n=1 Tax=Xylophilus sp. GOD-11R TaxID=3089814 RepID=UPI00298D2B92|nr:MBL fold metallo-hydrolase [Xylophilus sp. GOD-11R]WPB55874.1 MBL fold metallo-hydrolase [Xylophilus sp. GOD-11R]